MYTLEHNQIVNFSKLWTFQIWIYKNHGIWKTALPQIQIKKYCSDPVGMLEKIND